MINRKKPQNMRNSRRNQPTRRPVRRNRHGGKGQDKSTIKRLTPVVALMMFFAAVLGGVGRMATVSASTIKMNMDTYCFDSPNIQYNAVPVFIDASTTRLFAEDNHVVSLKRQIRQQTDALKSNERIDVYTTETITDVVEPVVSMCMPPASLDEIDSLAFYEPDIQNNFTQAQLNNLTLEAHEKIEGLIGHVIEQSLQKSEKRWTAPLLEQMRNISNHYRSTQVDDMIVFSAGIQASTNLAFCFKQGHLPRFSKFKNGNSLYNSLKLFDGFQNTDVVFLMPRVLDKWNVGKYCEQHEIENWWKAYFEDGGANIFVQPLLYEYGGMKTKESAGGKG